VFNGARPRLLQTVLRRLIAMQLQLELLIRDRPSGGLCAARELQLQQQWQQLPHR
jgi:hypothetical protein